MAKGKDAAAGDIFDEKNRLPRDLAEGWFKFENVGDKVGGEILDMFETPAQNGMPAQRVFTVKQSDETVINVPLKRTPYILARTDMLQVGDMLGVRFEKEIPAKVKGHHPAKSLVIFSKLNGPRTQTTARTLEAPEVKADEDDFDLPGNDA
jgi:hypothetical protein